MTDAAQDRPVFIEADHVSWTVADADAAAVGRSFGASAIKLRCRAGMGLCQGRTCEHAIIRRIALARGCEEGDIAGFRPRFPARAVSVAELLD